MSKENVMLIYMYFTYTFHFSSSDWRLQRDSIHSDWVQTEDCRDWDSMQNDWVQTEDCRKTLYRVTAEYRLKTAERLYTEWPPQSIDLKTVERLYTKWLNTVNTTERLYTEWLSTGWRPHTKRRATLMDRTVSSCYCVVPKFKASTKTRRASPV